MNATAKAAIAVVALGAAAYGLANLPDPPGQEECVTLTVLAPSDAGQVLETIEICGSSDGGLETGEELIPIHPREPEKAERHARGGKALGLHRGQPSGCACSSGSGCERAVTGLDGKTEWQAAPRGAVMQDGEHRGCTMIASCYDVSELPIGSNLAPECRPISP